MRQPVTFLTSSPYYSPAFNAAIFDGPFRIYFAQYQESLALRIYFDLQKQLKDEYQNMKIHHSQTHQNIFVMMYPTTDTFQVAFPEIPSGQNVVVRTIEDDFLIGICGVPEEKDQATLLNEVQSICRAWLSQKKSPVAPAVNEEAML